MRFAKPKGIFKKLLIYQSLLLLSIILVLFFTISLLEKRFWSNYLLKEANSSLRLLNPQIMRTFGRSLGKTDNEKLTIQNETRDIIKDKEGILDVNIIDNEGRELYSFNRLNLPAFKLDAYQKSGELFYREITINKKKALDLVQPQQTMGFSNFYIRYIMYFPVIETQISNINSLLLLFGLIGALVSVVFSYLYAKKITVPLRILEEKAKAIKRGEIEQDIPVLEDEIGELAEALRTMLFEIKKKQNELIMQNERLNEAFNEVLFLQNQMLNYEKFAALGKISAGMSHEIDNPLGIIIGHAEYLKEELPEQSEFREDIETIIREALRIKGIMRSLLSFAKPKESKIKEIELYSFTKKVLDNFSFQKIFRNIKLTFEGAETYVFADEEKLHQVLVNVILNAIQAMQRGGELIVNLAKSEEYGVLRITDTGIGIPEEIQSKVFEIFFSTKKDGTGLGLAVTKSFMDDMNGRIELISKENKGTTIILYFPLKCEK